MSVGNPLTKATLDNQLTAAAVTVRDLMGLIRQNDTPVTNMGLSGLENLGYGSTPNPDNPGGISDAAYCLELWGYLNTLQGVYYGQVQQGGTGGTGATLFDFDNALSSVWGGQ